MMCSSHKSQPTKTSYMNHCKKCLIEKRTCFDFQLLVGVITRSSSAGMVALTDVYEVVLLQFGSPLDSVI